MIHDSTIRFSPSFNTYGSEKMGNYYDAKQFFGNKLDYDQIFLIYEHRQAFMAFRVKEVGVGYGWPADVMNLINQYFVGFEERKLKKPKLEQLCVAPTYKQYHTIMNEKKEEKGENGDKDEDDEEEEVDRCRVCEKVEDMFCDGWFGELQMQTTSPYLDTPFNHRWFFVYFPLPKKPTAPALLQWFKELEKLNPDPLEMLKSFFCFKLDEPKLRCVPHIH